MPAPFRVIVFAALLAAVLPAQQPAEMDLTLENTTRETRISQVEFSPDGKRLAFVSNRGGGSKIWIVPVAGGEPKQLLPGAGSESSPKWSPDGRTIVCLSAQQGQPDIYAVAADGGTPRRVTNDTPAEQGMSWSPDGSRIAYVARHDDYRDVYVVDSAGGKAKQVTQNFNAWDEPRWTPTWSPDGSQILFVSNKSEYYSDDLWLVNADGSKPVKLTADLRVMTNPQWSKDGKFIAYNAVRYAEYWWGDQTDIYVTEMPSRRTRRLPLNTFVTDLNGNVSMQFGPDGRTLYFRYQWRGNTNVWAVNIESDGIATQLTNGQGQIQDIDVSPAGNGIAFVRSTQMHGADLYLQPAIGGEPKVLVAWGARYKGTIPPVQVSFRSTDGKYIHGYLYKPPKIEPGQKYPGLVQVHGGGNNAYGNGFHSLEHYLSHKGFVVVAIEYRGSSGYGRPFQSLSTGDWAAGQGWDAVAASDYLRSLDYVNGKIGIYGGSYGGIMSMAAITRDSSKFQAGAPFYGIFDWPAAYQDADRLGKFWVVVGHKGFRPEDDPEMYERTSTIKHLKDVTTPLLIIHGELDRRAPYKQSVRLVEELKKLGKTVEFYHYPDEEHGFRRPANRMDATTKMEAWFNKYLR